MGRSRNRQSTTMLPNDQLSRSGIAFKSSMVRRQSSAEMLHRDLQDAGTSFQSIEDIRNTTTRLQERIGNEDVSRILKDLRKDVDSLLQRMAASENRQSQIEDTVAQKDEMHSKKFDAIEEDLLSQDNSLIRLFEQMHLLEAAALKYRPSTVILIVRRELDDARFCVADAFMIIFPKFFRNQNIMNKHEKGQGTVEWWKFKICLDTLFDRHFKAYEHGSSFYQTASAFSYCDRDALLNVRDDDNNKNEKGKSTTKTGENDEDVEQGISVFTREEIPNQLPPRSFSPPPDRPRARSRLSDEPDTSMFQSKLCTEYVQGMDSEVYLSKQLWFFVPVFIWAYNELKRAVLNDKRRLLTLNSQSARRARLISTLQTIDTNSFALGTGVEIRKEVRWGGFLKDFKMDPILESESELDRHPTVPCKRDRLTSDEENISDEGGSSSTRVKQLKVESKASNDTVAQPMELSSPPLSPTTAVTPRGENIEGGVNIVDVEGDPPEDSQLVVEIVKDSLSDVSQKVKDAERIFERRLKKFNALRKLLTILLDSGMFNLAVLGNSVVREATRYYAHPLNNIEDGLTVDALGRVQELVANYCKELSKPMPDINLEADSKRLSQVIYQSNKYFDEGGVTRTENAVDEHLRMQSTELGATSSCTDLHILLSWLESLHPVH